MKNKFLTILIFVLAFFIFVNLVQAASIITNVSETNINSTVLIMGDDFLPSTNYYIIPLLENKSAWWDGYDENWFFNKTSNNNTINVTTNVTGGFSYALYIPNDWRVSGGKVLFKIGQNLSSALLWSSQGANWTATIPTKNGITGDSDPNGFIYTVNTAGINTGGIEKIYKINGSQNCNYTTSLARTFNDITNNGTYLYAVTSTTTDNLYLLNMSSCGRITNFSTVSSIAYSVNVAPNNEYIIITYAAGVPPRMYNITNATPVNVATFINNTVLPAAIAYDSCISLDSNTIYTGYANGNVTAQNKTGYVLWNSDPEEMEFNSSVAAFPVNGLSCDNTFVYVGRGSVAFPVGVTNQGFVEALYVANGSRAWINSKTDTIYDGMDVSNLRCDGSSCYVVKALTPAPYTGVVGSAIMQINKTNGNVTWWNWRSWLPLTYGLTYGDGGVHIATQALWVDTEVNGSLYPVYTYGWTQKISKNDVNASIYDPNLWIRGNTNFWNYAANVQKNIWLSNETPYYNFKNWNQQGIPLNVSNYLRLGTTYFRFSNLNTFNSFTATETAPSLFIDPVMQTTVTQNNTIFMFNQTFAPSCPSTRYGPNLTGWHYVDRTCHYEEVPAQNASFNIGTTINGTFITGVIYSLIKTKFWEDYPLTKYYGNDKWAWSAMYNGTNDQVVGFATKFGNDQEDVYSDILGRAVLFTNYGSTNYYRPQFRADYNRKTDNYIFFMPTTYDSNNVIGENTLWRRIDIETQKVANPVVINLSNDEDGIFEIGTPTYTYGHRINFTAQEPNLFNRTNEPVEIIFNATGGIRSDCQDVIITDTGNTQIDLWQVDNFTACSQNGNVSVWIMMNWTQNETKNLLLYYNSSNSIPVALGTTDLTITNASGSCGTNNHEINIYSSNWYNWSRPAAITPTNEVVKFNFNVSTINLFQSALHYQVAMCYKNSNTTNTGAGASADSCSYAIVPVVSRCLQSGLSGKIFAKLNATATVGNITSRLVSNKTLNIEYYFFANTGRVRIRTQLNETIRTINWSVSKNWPPYYYFSINSFIPPYSNHSWIYYSGLYDQMKRPVANISADWTEANLSASPLPMMFTIKYGNLDNISQSNGSIFRAASLDESFWGKGCTAHKTWQFYNYAGGGDIWGIGNSCLYGGIYNLFERYCLPTSCLRTTRICKCNS